MFKRVLIGILAAACVFCLSGCVIQLPAQNQTTSSASQGSQDQTASGGSASGTQDASGQDQASSGGEISRDDALTTVLEHAGVSQGEAYNVKVERDGDNGIPIYDIEFETDYGDYDYEIAIADGSIVGTDYEVREEWAYQQPEQSVSEDEVRALVQQKVPGAPASDIQIRQERDDGRFRYEGSLSYNDMYYEFEVDGQTGIILDWNADLRR